MSPGDDGKLSLTVLPMMYRSSKTTPGELALTVTPSIRRPSPLRRSTRPESPKERIGLPVRLSSAHNQLRCVKRRRSPITVTPRWRNRCEDCLPKVGSKLQSSRPVAASSAMTRNLGVVAYSTPSMTIGFDCISEPLKSSWVSYVHATASCLTLAGVICERVE